VPDGLAGGLLAGVNPVYGLYGYLFGMLGAALFTSSQFMTVQATGAMAAVVSDVSEVHTNDEPNRVLFTLALLTGVVMFGAGLLRLGSILRFVSNAVMVGFITGVGINIVLGQLGDFTGYDADGSNRLSKTLDLLFNLGQIRLATVAVGVLTIVLIVTLERTRLGALSLVVAVIVGSAIVPILDWDVARLADIISIPQGLPRPQAPLFGKIPILIIPAFSLAFVGLVQGAGITANFPNPDGKYPEASRDFIGQGIGNLVSGTFQGMPVGGSMSATSIVTAAGSTSRLAQVIAAGVMAIIIVLFGGLVDETAMPALAGLLIIVGYRTVKPKQIIAVWKTGQIQAATMTVTLVLTILIPLQFAVLVGVGMSTLLFVIRQSNDLVIKQLVVHDGGIQEADPPSELPPDEVVVIQPYGSLFFASASVFEKSLPTVTSASTNSVVIVRLRGRTDLGSTLTETLSRYAEALHAKGSKLVMITDHENVMSQLAVTGVTKSVGEENLYRSGEWLGRTLQRAYSDAEAWVAARQGNQT
jgi:SulP family sulfate permease